MTFLELCKRTRRACGIQGSGPVTVSDRSGIEANIVDWVAEADQLIQSEYPDWKFLWNEWSTDTQANVSLYSGDSDLGYWDQNSFVLDRGTDSSIKLSYIDYSPIVCSEETSCPSTISIRPDNKLQLNCKADDEYELSGYYWKAPAKMTANTDVSLIPLQFHMIIVRRATMFFAEEKEHIDLLNYTSKEYLTLLDWLVAHSGENLYYLNMIAPPSLGIRSI